MILKRSTEFVLLAAGIVLVCIGGLLNFYSQDLLQYTIYKQFILSETANIYPYWMKNPIKISDHMYFFNWTNPSDLKEPGYKPKFEEVGPYAFEETLEKANVVWNDNGTVTYRKARTWFFKREASIGSMSDYLTTLNPLAVSGAYVTRHWMSFARKSFSLAFAGTQQMHVTRTIGEITFEGYTDPLLDAGSMLPGFADMIPYDRVGYFYQMNGSSTSEGIFNVETGVHGLDSVGRVNTWNYRNTTSFYDTPCGEVKGTAGEFWPPKRRKTDDVVFFSAELCRYVVFRYKKTVTIHGIEGYRYEPHNLFDNGTSNPANECFCSGECVPSGALNVSSCRFGAPGFVSNAHFYNADPSYRDSIEGMRPDSKKHEVYIVIEPTYGLLLETVGRLQLNMMVQPDSDISLFVGIPRLFFPIFWVEQKTALPANLAIYVKIALVMPSVAYILSIILVVMGSLFLVLFFMSRIQPRYKKNLMDIHISFNNKNNLTSAIEKEVISPLIKVKPKPEIIPTMKESNI